MGHVNEGSQGNIGSHFGGHGGRGHYMMFPSSEPHDATDEHSSWLGTLPERPSQPQQMYPATSQQWYPAQSPPAQQAYQAAPQERVDSGTDTDTISTDGSMDYNAEDLRGLTPAPPANIFSGSIKNTSQGGANTCANPPEESVAL